MRYLLDTQALVWFIENNPKLSAFSKGLIEEPDNEIFVSQSSYVEVAIKASLNKLVVKGGLQLLMKEANDQDIQTLTVVEAHILAYNRIPLNENHRDPFDRMILATALAEKLPIMSADEK